MTMMGSAVCIMIHVCGQTATLLSVLVHILNSVVCYQLCCEARYFRLLPIFFGVVWVLYLNKRALQLISSLNAVPLSVLLHSCMPSQVAAASAPKLWA